jgi:hypothetical protein
MKRFLVYIILCVAALGAKAQLYTGGRGDGAAISCIPPVINTIGETEFTCVGDSIVLKVYASGSQVRYIWQKMGTNKFEDLQIVADKYAGIGTGELIIKNLTAAVDSGIYRCVAVNSCDSDTSEYFDVNFNRAPWKENPLSLNDYAQGVCANTGYIDLISSFGYIKNDVKYQWRKIDTLYGTVTELPNTSRDLRVNLMGSARDAEGLYVVSASNPCGIIHDSVYLPVYRSPEITWTNPVTPDGKIYACSYESLLLNATMSGGGIYSFVLQKVIYDLATDTWISSDGGIWVSTPEYFMRTVTSWDAAYYRWAVYNQCSENNEPTYSDIIEVVVIEAPFFTQHAADQLVCEGSPLELICEADGLGVEYYWTHNGHRIPGADSNVLVIDEIKEGDAGSYVCVAYNSCVSKVTSRTIRVTVDPLPRLERDPYMMKKACLGDSLTYFNAIANNDIQLDSVRWYFDYQPIYNNDHYEDTDSLMMVVNRINQSDLGFYQIMMYNHCGSRSSEFLKLTELALPVDIKGGLDGYNLLLCPGMEQKLGVSVTGSRPIQYKWVVNEHAYETDTNFVTVKGQNITERNKYTVYAYNACGSSIDSGWIDVEVFERYKFTGEGEYCDGHTPTGKLHLSGTEDTLMYHLYRDYGVLVETRRGNGRPMEFTDMPGGEYYVVAENPKTECRVEMNGKPFIVKHPSPIDFNFYVSSYFCMGNSGADLVLSGWEDEVIYRLYRNTGSGYEELPYAKFTGGRGGFSIPEMNSPPAGQPKIYTDMKHGRYQVVATGRNACTRTMVLNDSIQIIPPPSRHTLSAYQNDTVNCHKMMSSGEPLFEYARLEVDRFLEGAKYYLYKNGVVHPDFEPDRMAPIEWTGLDEGEYHVLVETKEGCTATTNKIRIHSVTAPAQQTLSLSGNLCAHLDTDTDFKVLTIDNTEPEIRYDLYRRSPAKLWGSVTGDGTGKEFIIPAERATFYVKATDPTGLCTTSMTQEVTVLASDFYVELTPSDIFIDPKGTMSWLHVDIKGDYVEPLDVVWADESQLQQTGVVTGINTPYHKQYYWPFCPCAGNHDGYGEYADRHARHHSSSCTLPTCPYLYHAFDPSAHACTYLGTEYQTAATYGYPYRTKWYDLYFCRDMVTDEAYQEFYQNDTTNPFRDRLTTPINEDREYTVTVTDGAGCTHEDHMTVRVMGARLRGHILFSEIHKHYEYPFCPCYSQHIYHYCTINCNENGNCPRLYHSHKHEGCVKQGTELILYKGSYVKYYDLYYCCTNQRAQDTVVYRNDELFFCSEAYGGDFTYRKTWWFEAENASDSWSGPVGDTVTFKANSSGWLHLRITSMDEEVRDSIWIDVLRRPFNAYITDAHDRERRIDSLYLCRGEEAHLFAKTSGGDSPNTYLQWFGEGEDGPSSQVWIYEPRQSGWVELTARNDDITIRDRVYILVREAPTKPELENAGVRCVVPNRSEYIKIQAPTVVGNNYILEYSADQGATYIEKERENHSLGGAIEFKVPYPVRDAGLYRVRVENPLGDHACTVYSEPIEFIAPPAHEEIEALTYCEGSLLSIQFKSTSEGMSYSLLTNTEINFETISHPRDYFDKPVGANTYKIVYRRDGQMGSCADTIDITVRKVVPPNQVTSLVNGLPDGCEGINATITFATESGVIYYLESAKDGSRTPLFTGNGDVMETTISGRSYGTYRVMGEREGCPTLVDWFVFNRNPKTIAVQDQTFCYPYGRLDLGKGIDMELNGLEAGVTYTLLKEGVYQVDRQGPGLKTFTGLLNGNYTLVAKNDETGCIASTNFVVTANEAPKDFTFSAACEQGKALTLNNSQKGVEYTLHRDESKPAILSGTGKELLFGVFQETGIYTVTGKDTLTGCETLMNGAVPVTHFDSCRLEKTRSICVTGDVTELLYPCSSIGWSYYLKDITVPTEILSSEILEGNGGAIRWSSVGDRMIKQYQKGRMTMPSVYELYARDVCGDILLETFEVAVAPAAKGHLEMENMRAGSQLQEGCINEFDNFYVNTIGQNVSYTLLGITDGNYRDSLSVYTAGAVVSEGRHLLGTFRGYDEYHLVIEFEGCSRTESIVMDYREMPKTDIEVIGEDKCGNEGDLELSLPNRESDHNYYLHWVANGVAKQVDTLLYTGLRNEFRPQNAPGRYWIIAENVESASGVRLCRDTVRPSFAYGASPTPYQFVSYPEMSADVYLCTGDSSWVMLRQSEPAVTYSLFREGVEYSPIRQFRNDGGPISFVVREPGVYTVRGFLGDCEIPMEDSVVVWKDDTPELELYDTYYFCIGTENAAKIEVLGAPYLSTFELREFGLASPPVERDTVHRYWGDGISDTISFNHLCQEGDEYQYVLTYKTRYGCRGHHYFKVEGAAPPDPFEVISTGNAVCEGESTRFAILGDQRGVEYTLMKVDEEIGDYEYNDNYIVGWGDRDTMWFPYPVYDRGTYYVTATYYYRPQCQSILNINGKQQIELAEIDTLRECEMESYQVRYCADAFRGTNLVLNNAEQGMRYYLVREGFDMYDTPVEWVLYCNVEGETLVWSDVSAFEVCDGDIERPTRYRVLAENPRTRCTKWMGGYISVYADKMIDITVSNYPYYEFCEGTGALLKTRSTGCGASYEWFRITTTGEELVGSGADFMAQQAGVYFCRVSNSCLPPAESEQTIVVVKPQIEMVPMGVKNLCEGAPAVVHSQFYNMNDGDFVWYRIDEPEVILSTSGWLEFKKVTKADQGYYVCIGGSTARNYCNILMDTVFIQVLNHVDSAKVELVYDTVCVGTTRTVSVNLPGYDLQWFFNGARIPGSTTSAISRTFSTTADAGLYAIQISNACGERDPIPVKQVTVDTDITHLWHTEDKFLCASAPLDLSIRTSPMSGVRFQWEELIGRTVKQLGNTPDVSFVQVPENVSSITYRAYFWNTCNDYTTANYQDVFVTVATNIRHENQWPEEIHFCEGSGGDDASRTLTAALAGTNVHEYMWLFSPAGTTRVDTILRGPSANSYIIPDLREASGLYTCMMETDCGKMKYKYSTWVRINTPVAITQDLDAETGRMCEGTLLFTPTVCATGSDLQFRWVLYRKDGRIDTIARGMGYDWMDCSTLQMATNFDNLDDTLRCVVYNGCGTEVSETLVLKIEGRRTLRATAEPWVCYDSLGSAIIQLLDHNGDPLMSENWSYKYQREDGNPRERTVIGGKSRDTLYNLSPGRYVVKDFTDGVCNYAGIEMATFTIEEKGQATATMSLSEERRDTTICAGAKLPFRIQVQNGVGPYEVTLWYRTSEIADWEVYNEWPGSNPFYIESAAAAAGYEYALPILKAGEFKVTVQDFYDENSTGERFCPVIVADDQTVLVRLVAHSAVTWRPGSITRLYGECQLPLDLVTVLNPTPADGVFHIAKRIPGEAEERSKMDYNEAMLTKPGTYVIGYSSGGVCMDPAPSTITLTIDSLPSATILPRDTVICSQSDANIYIELRGTMPFQYMHVETERMRTDGSLASFPGEEFWAFPNTPTIQEPRHRLYLMPATGDSIVKYTVTNLQDAHGCFMPILKRPYTAITVAPLPQIEVEGSHPLYGNGHWNSLLTQYNLPEGDSVKFRITLSKGQSPWTLKLKYGESTALFQEQPDITVYGRDTVLTARKAGVYEFNCVDANGCTLPFSGRKTRTITFAPDGFISLSGVYLGGAMAHRRGQELDGIPQVSWMKSELYGNGFLPSYGNAALLPTTWRSLIIDWIFVEARKQKADGTWSIVDRDTCWLMSNGQVWSREGSTRIRLRQTGTQGDLHHIVVLHRNHLPIMTKLPQQCSASSVTAITFAYEENFWTRDGGSLKDHAWPIATQYEVNVWAMAPAYKMIDEMLHLVSISNPNMTHFEELVTQPPYSLFDVNLNGVVEIPPTSIWTIDRLSTLPNAEDAWLLFLNRDCYSDIEEINTTP